MRVFTDDIGRVLAKLGPPPPGSAFLGGLAFSPLNEVYVTFATAPTDSYSNGKRISALGEAVIVVADPPFDLHSQWATRAGSDAVAVIVDGVPDANDPYINGGLRVTEFSQLFLSVTGDAGDGFDDGFDEGFGS